MGVLGGLGSNNICALLRKTQRGREKGGERKREIEREEKRKREKKRKKNRIHCKLTSLVQIV